MNDMIRILGFAGSLRKGSYNKAILRAALELVPDDAELETFDLEGIPPFNQDHGQGPSGESEGIQIRHPGRGCHPHCHARVQLLHSRAF